jgi:hypothetical protein
MSNIQTATITGQGKDINSAFTDACNKLMASVAQNNQIITNVTCAGFKELHPFKPAQRTTKNSTGHKGQKKWLNTFAVYVMNEATGLWMKAKLPDNIDASLKANVQAIARDLCLEYQCQTCVRIERYLADDTNNQIEETYSPVSIRLGTWNFTIKYSIGDPAHADTIMSAPEVNAAS